MLSEFIFNKILQKFCHLLLLQSIQTHSKKIFNVFSKIFIVQIYNFPAYKHIPESKNCRKQIDRAEMKPFSLVCIVFLQSPPRVCAL